MKLRVQGQVFDHSRREWVLMPQDIEAASGDEAAAIYLASVRDIVRFGKVAIKGIEPVPTSDEPPNRGNVGEPPPEPPRRRPGRPPTRASMN